jgi:ATP-binding protein involved in chromosome partitioning
MAVTQARVLEALKRIKGPDLTSNIVDLGLVSEVLIRDDKAYFSITVPAERAEELEPLRQAAEKVVRDIPGLNGVSAVLTADATGSRRPAAAGGGAGSRSAPPESRRVQEARARMVGEHGRAHDHAHAHGHSHAAAASARGAPAGQAQPGARRAAGVPGIRHLIAVASGKGGVGKSTAAVNLALAFQANGLKAGILDADVYGPSQPRLLGLTGRPEVGPGNRLQPLVGYGLKCMSMGFMVDEATPVIWRGPMVVQALTQMLRDVEWGELDVLVIDMPPGTGDVQLTMAQQVPLSGAVIVSTPQDLALIDARKGLNMFKRTDVPVLGIIENMSYFICPKCGERHEIFGHGGAEDEAAKLGVPFLGAVPLHIDIRARSDAGEPIVATEPASAHARIFSEIAAKTWAEILAAEGTRPEPPTLVPVEDGTALDVTFPTARYRLPAEMLRVMSPSAEVQGHSPEQRVTVAGKRNVRIRNLQPVGNYAVRIGFDDGHDTGLFTWDYLERLGREKESRWAKYLEELAQKGLSRG